MIELLKKWRILLLIACILFAVSMIFTEQLGPINSGVKYGLELKGGTYYQIQLEEKVPKEQMEFITSIITQRVDAFGLKDIRVNAMGPDLVGVQISETDPQKLAQIETIIKTQAKFESMLEGKVLFRGADIRQISKDPALGYGIYQREQGYEWRLPFTLSQESAETFSKGIFHKCTATGVNQYDCVNTFFFIDRPNDSVVLVPQAVYDKDNGILLVGDPAENISEGLSVDSLMSNANTPYFVVFADKLDQNQSDALAALSATKKKVIVSPEVPAAVRQQAEKLGFKVVEIKNDNEKLPWTWAAIGTRQSISITPEIAGFDPYIENVQNAQVHASIYIRGSSADIKEADEDLRSLEILLRTGSLPVGIKGFSKETISPLLGKEFLSTSLLIGIAAFALVFIILFIRYRKPLLAMPIILFGMIELLLTTGFSAFFGINLDLSAIAGLIAAIGTGLNDQIVIVDELLKGGAATSEATYTNRLRKAFFIVIAAAATIVASLSPIVLFANAGFAKLAGFALTEILGVFIGVLVTRPAFAIIAEHIIKRGKY